MQVSDEKVEVKVTVEDMRAVRLEMYDPKGSAVVVFFGLINVPLKVAETGEVKNGNLWYKPTDRGFEVIGLDDTRQEDLDGAIALWDKHKAAGTLLSPENAELLSSLEVGDQGLQ